MQDMWMNVHKYVLIGDDSRKDRMLHRGYRYSKALPQNGSDFTDGGASKPSGGVQPILRIFSSSSFLTVSSIRRMSSMVRPNHLSIVQKTFL